ncbi:fungal-specific transcription factor domain-containing protein [Fusarium oxysporum f. sp. albedinis]|nr:fungal-specific transcription factor domain-containing protein [Fusarium oxysporum f. sp. albedinis]
MGSPAGSSPYREMDKEQKHGGVQKRLSTMREKKGKAYRRCKERKTKCSKVLPCEPCLRAGSGADCRYPQKLRFVNLAQVHLRSLKDADKRLKWSEDEDGVEELHGGGDQIQLISQAPTPALQDMPPFLGPNPPHLPSSYGTASDIAFAAQFCIPTSSQQFDMAVPWPNQARARLLLDVSLDRVSRDYYIVQKSHVRRDLEQFLLNKTPIDTLSKCKLHALFAIGEVYMARSFVSKSTFPGMNHFIMAKRALQMVSDKPQIGMIELQLLLSYYCFFLNQLRSAYTQASYAIQLALIIGLHREKSDNECDDVAIREHRQRVWWTVCTFDRMRAYATGLPISVPDDLLEVDLPFEPRPMSAMQDFEDFAYVKAQVQLSKLTFTAINALHQRKHDILVQAQAHGFLARLRNWVNNLSPLLQSSTDSIPSCDRQLNLRLSFNQSVICITRPLWNCVVLPTSLSLTTNPPCPPQNTYFESSLLEAGIECAQQTCKFLIELWIRGSFLTFDCVYTRYLFSALTILLLAYMLNDEEYNEVQGQFEVAAHILTQLKESGNALAAEYCLHIDGMRRMMSRHETVLGIGACSYFRPHSKEDRAGLIVIRYKIRLL